MSNLLYKIESEKRTPVVLSDYIKIKHGFAFKGEYFGEQGSHVVVTPGNFFEEGGFRRRKEKDKWYSGPISKDYVLGKGDLIVAMTEQGEGLLGSSALIPHSDLFLHNQRIGLVEIKNEDVIDRRYLYYLLNTRGARSHVQSSASGTKVRHTSPDRIASYEYDFPTLPTQKKVAQILNAYDEKIDNNNLIIKNLESVAQAIFNEWFVDFRFPGHEKAKFVESEMGDIPEGWGVKNVMDVIERISVGKKYDNKSALISGKVPILDQGQSGFIGYHNEEPGVTASLDKPVVVFTNHTCYYRLLTEPFSCIQNVLPYVGKEGYSTFFIYFLTREKVKMQEYKGHWPEFEQQIFVIPPVVIANQFADKAKALIEKMVGCEKENVMLKETRDRLITKLI